MRGYVVELPAEERAALDNAIARNNLQGRELTRARILLEADRSADGPGRTSPEIAAATGVSLRTVKRVRRRYVLGGLTAALTHRHPRRGDPA